MPCGSPFVFLSWALQMLRTGWYIVITWVTFFYISWTRNIHVIGLIAGEMESDGSEEWRKRIQTTALLIFLHKHHDVLSPIGLTHDIPSTRNLLSSIFTYMLPIPSLCASVMGWIVYPKKIYEVLTLDMCEGYLLWK